MIPSKELDVCEIYPQWLSHNSNGRFAVVTGDGEYIIYTALAWRKKAFGSALDFVWALDSGDYAVRESAVLIKLFKNFKETRTFKPPFQADAIYGGALLGVRSGEVTFFFDWVECRLVRRIDVQPKEVKWSESGELVVLVCEDSLFLLRYSRDVAFAALESGQPIGEEGVDEAFELVHEVSEQVRTCVWVGECLVYTTKAGRLNYTVGGEVVTLQHLDRPLHIVGYLPKENRIYLLDRDDAVVSYQLLLSVLNYQTAVVRRDLVEVAAAPPSPPPPGGLSEPSRSLLGTISPAGGRHPAVDPAVGAQPDRALPRGAGLQGGGACRRHRPGASLRARRALGQAADCVRHHDAATVRGPLEAARRHGAARRRPEARRGVPRARG